jgi:hypothetical protein
MTGCRVALLPMKYFGLHLGAPYESTSIWNYLSKKWRGGWKRLYLSKGGGLTLIKCTLSNLPTYYLSLFPIPRGVANRIQKLQRDYYFMGMY